MRCEKAKKLIVDYVYQELSERQRKRLKEHLAQCWGCSFELESFQKTIDLVKSQTEVEESEQFWKESWGRIGKRLPQSKAALKNRTLFGQVWHWLLDTRLPPPGWLFHEFILRRALPAFGVIVFVVCVSLLAIHIFQTKTGGQKPPAERAAEGEIVLELPERSGENGIRMGFYILEHERASLQLASARNVSHRQIFLRWDDLLYYDTVGERPESGLIMRGRSDRHERSGHEIDGLKLKRVYDVDTISLEEAKKLVSFNVVAPSLIASSYAFTGIRKVKGRECVQLLYSNGANTFSLFQQPLVGKERLDRWDFREYIFGLGKDGERSSVLGWYTDEIIFNLVGKADLSYMTEIADEIREYYLMDGVKAYYLKHAGQGR